MEPGFEVGYVILEPLSFKMKLSWFKKNSDKLAVSTVRPATHPTIIYGLPWWLSGESPPARTGDMGLIPGQGRCHMPLSS